MNNPIDRLRGDLLAYADENRLALETCVSNIKEVALTLISILGGILALGGMVLFLASVPAGSNEYLRIFGRPGGVALFLFGLAIGLVPPDQR